MKGIIIYHCLICIFILGPITTSAEQLNMSPGEWEVCGAMEGMPMSCVTQCYKSEELIGDKITLPGRKAFQDEEECSIIYYNKSGTTISWKFQCESKGTKDIEGKVTYSGNYFEGKVISKVNFSGVKGDWHTLTTHIKGKFLNNDCSK